MSHVMVTQSCDTKKDVKGSRTNYIISDDNNILAL